MLGALPAADVTFANLTLASVERLGSRIRSSLLVSSGYLASEWPEVSGFRHRERLSQGGWAADLLERE
jgi:hypothetical protein